MAINESCECHQNGIIAMKTQLTKLTETSEAPPLKPARGRGFRSRWSDQKARNFNDSRLSAPFVLPVQTRFRHDQTRHPYDTPPIAGDFHLSDFIGSLQLLHNRGAALPSWRTGPFRRIQRALRRSSGTMSLKVTCPCWSGASPCSVNSFGLRYPRVGWSRWSSDHHT